MATLEKIRSKAGLLVLVVGLALFAFIIGDFLKFKIIKVALMRWPRCIRCNPVQPACPRNI